MPADLSTLLALAQSLAERSLALDRAEHYWPLLAGSLTEAFGCERVTLFRTEKDRLVSCYAVGLKEPLVIAPGEGIAGQVASSRKSRLCNEPYGDEAFSRRVDGQSGFKTTSLLAVPLVAQDRVVGVVELLNKPGGFTAEDAAGMEFVASQVAMVFALFASAERESQMALHVLQMEKMAAIGRLVAGFSHEVRNPLTVIVGYAETLASRAKDPKDAEALAKIRQNAHRIEALVKSLLGFSRTSRETIGPIDLGALLDTTLELVLLEDRWKGVKIVREYDPAAPEVSGNVNTIMQVFLNLIMNALQAMDGRPGSRLVLRVRPGSGRREVLAEVEDSGPGMPPEVRDRVFEDFFTTKGRQGTGLGLSIVQGIVQKVGGRIALDTAPGKGTTFTLAFPVA